MNGRKSRVRAKRRTPLTVVGREVPADRFVPIKNRKNRDLSRFKSA